MNLGGAEILVIIVVALLVLGPDKLPAALRMFGRAMGEVRKYQDLAKSEIEKAMAMPDESHTKKPEPEKSTEDTKTDDKDGGVAPDERVAGSKKAVSPILDDDDE